jgi:hypothetical protein
VTNTISMCAAIIAAIAAITVAVLKH